jgi:starvation-inducible outer membrane lipoprotein
MKTKKYLILYVLAFFVIAGCSSTPTETQSEDPVSTVKASKNHIHASDYPIFR